MHVLREPIARHLAAVAFRLCRVVDFLPDGGELRAHADVVDEAGDLALGVAPFDSTADEICQRRQGAPIDAPVRRMITQLEIFTLETRQLLGCDVVLGGMGMDNQRIAGAQSFVRIRRAAWR